MAIKQKIRTVGKSWVIRLPKTFTETNKLQAGTQVLLTLREGSAVDAEILPPLDEKVSRVAERVLKRHKKVFEELKRIGD